MKRAPKTLNEVSYSVTACAITQHLLGGSDHKPAQYNICTNSDFPSIAIYLESYILDAGGSYISKWDKCGNDYSESIYIQRKRGSQEQHRNWLRISYRITCSLQSGNQRPHHNLPLNSPTQVLSLHPDSLAPPFCHLPIPCVPLPFIILSSPSIACVKISAYFTC